jgi:hypothetical protein
VLLVLLVAGGAGSRVLASGEGALRRRRLGLALGGLVLLVPVTFVAASRLFEALPGLSPLGRALGAALLLAPLGFLLGTALPAGFRAVAERAPTRIPWLWCVNSATSVLGSVLATLSSLHYGITATAMAGAALYAMALALSRRVAYTV